MTILGPHEGAERDPVGLGELDLAEPGLEQGRQGRNRKALDKPSAAAATSREFSARSASANSCGASLIVAQGRLCKLLNRVKRRPRRFTMRGMSRACNNF